LAKKGLHGGSVLVPADTRLDAPTWGHLAKPTAERVVPLLSPMTAWFAVAKAQAAGIMARP
jgi:hypothetical protein